MTFKISILWSVKVRYKNFKNNYKKVYIFIAVLNNQKNVFERNLPSTTLFITLVKVSKKKKNQENRGR
jgi:hypothetical protein